MATRRAQNLQDDSATRLQHGRNQVPSRKQEARRYHIAEESSRSTVLCRSVMSTLDDPMDCSPPGSSVHGTLQAKTLQWVAMPSSRGSSQSGDQTQVSCLADGFFTIWATREAQTVAHWICCGLWGLTYSKSIIYLKLGKRKNAVCLPKIMAE